MSQQFFSNAAQKPVLQFAAESRKAIDQYLPDFTRSEAGQCGSDKPFVTLTYAQSLDSKISLAPGIQTALSGPETKAMTHYLRSKHDAILVGVGTAIADDPALNCRLEGVSLDGQPRPVILDSHARWDLGKSPDRMSSCMALARTSHGKGPWIMTTKQRDQIDAEKVSVVEGSSGCYISMDGLRDGMQWQNILTELSRRGIRSVMIEGGAQIINSLLQTEGLNFVNTVIITIAPVWLGDGGVNVSPPTIHSTKSEPVPAARLFDVRWQQFGQDVVMCGKINR